MKKTFIISAAMAASLTAFPWGQKGHDTVTCIAENHLTPTAKATIDSLLSGRSMVYYANWLDNASHTPEYAYSKTWHYKNIDADETYRSARKNPKGDIVEAINTQYEILRNPSAPAEDRTLALKMVIHLVGDIHQPMHMGRASDLGGNRHNLKYFNNATNLHRVWDSQVLEGGHKWSYTEWQQQLDRITPAQEKELAADGNPEAWGKESYEIAKTIYDQTPVNHNVTYDYIAKWTPVIEQRLLSAGIRLADLLNTALDPVYKGGYSPLPK